MPRFMRLLVASTLTASVSVLSAQSVQSVPPPPSSGSTLQKPTADSSASTTVPTVDERSFQRPPSVVLNNASEPAFSPAFSAGRSLSHESMGPSVGPSLKSVALATTLAAGIFIPLDKTIASHARVMAQDGDQPVSSATSALNWIGGAGSIAIPVTLATVGWVTGKPSIKEMGFHATESVVLSAGITGVLKGITGRTRPASSSLDPDDFTFRAGFRRNTATSFPSGHTTAAFAMATSLTLETMRSHPNAKWLVGLTSYGLASGVGFARVYADRHWSSDVAVGAGIGTLTGILVDRWVHSDHPHHGFLAWLH